MSRCVVISGGEKGGIPLPCEGDFVIACDRGVGYAAEEGIVPSLIIGDFDSYDGSLPSGVPVVRLRCEKDDTDTMHAVRYAVENGFDRLAVCCALGGRLDHTFANLQSGAYACEHGLDVTISGRGEEIFFLKGGKMLVEKRDGCSLSVFSVTDECVGVCIDGTKYKLHDHTLTSSFPLGVSNEWASDTAEISVREGMLMIVLSEK